MKRPSFQFYPSDWLQDAALRLCTVGARGLWMDMICYMHQGSDYGYLKVNHKVILPVNLARMVGATLPEVEGWINELEEAGVFSKDQDGCIFSRRMIRDEDVRNKRAEGGKLGGNPELLKVNHKVNHKVNLNANLRPTPSSSSSSSSSKNTPIVPKGTEVDDLLKRVKALFRMRESTPLDKSQSTAWKSARAIVAETLEDDWLALESVFQSTDPDTVKYRKQNLSTLLNQWNDSIIRAKNHSVQNYEPAQSGAIDWDKEFGQKVPQSAR